MSCSRQERIPQSIYENGTELRRGPWTLEEDSLLGQYIACHGEGRWNSLAKFAGLKRTGKSCRLRWLNYLKPNIKRGNLSHEEQLLILELHSKWGNRWSRIAQHLPGRTDNEIKNYWRTRVQKQARLLNIESNSSNFLEAIRMYWMPKLVEKMEQNSSSINSQSSSISIQEYQNQNLCQGNLLSSSLKPGNKVNNPDRDSISTNILENPRFLTAPGGQSLRGKSVEDDCYRVGIPGCDIQDFNPSGCHVEIDWPGEELGSTFWDADEPW